VKLLMIIATIQAIGWLGFFIGRGYERAARDVQDYRRSGGDRDFIRPGIRTIRRGGRG